MKVIEDFLYTLYKGLQMYMGAEYYENEQNVLTQAKNILQLKNTYGKFEELNLAINENEIGTVIAISIEISKKCLDARNSTVPIDDCVQYFITLDKILICKEKVIIDTECFKLLYSKTIDEQKGLRSRRSETRLPFMQTASRCKITYDRNDVDAWLSEEKIRQELKRSPF